MARYLFASSFLCVFMGVSMRSSDILKEHPGKRLLQRRQNIYNVKDIS